MDAAGASLGGVVGKALENLVKITGAYISKSARNMTAKAAVSLRMGFEEYLRHSYEKSRYFKTILNPNEPLLVKEHYVNLTLKCGSRVQTDDELIEDLSKLRAVIITGLAGSGKSMFMKYLTLLSFERSERGVPLFVELRHINFFSEKNLLAFIRASCTSKGSRVTEEHFNASLKSGALVLILDGFDELNYDHRDDIQKQIFSMRKEFPDVTIIISSRPDNRFGSWTSFYVYRVEELTKDQVKSLISAMPYDKEVKKRFSREVENKLYQSHKSFLSYPLLATIMLLTYESFAEIPDKMHAFYSQSFDTLFQKHDAQKEQYQRKTYTGLTREDFKSCLAAFCALSYLEQKYSFSDSKLIETANQAVQYLQQTSTKPLSALSGSQLVSDLRESVCMLQQDGLDTVFVHRSFQEYFAAEFATSLHSSKIKKILDRYATRFADSAVTMAFDMDRETIEQEWVLPTIKEITENLDLNNKNINLGSMYCNLLPNIVIFVTSRVSKEGEYFVDFDEINTRIIGQLEHLERFHFDWNR